MQNYLNQLEQLNQLFVHPSFDWWTFLGDVVLLAVTGVILCVGVMLILAANPIKIAIKVAMGIPGIETRRVIWFVVGLCLIITAPYPFSLADHLNKTREAERAAERTVHNTLMDMNEIDYKTLVEGANRYELDKNDTKKYKELIKIIKKAANRRPVQ